MALGVTLVDAMNETPLFDTLADLVRINSVNPAFAGGKPEADIVRYVREFFRQCGLETWEQAVLPDRPNLIACLPGHDRSRRLLLEAHVDTVTVQGMTISPFEPTVAHGRLYGRGACDTKAGLAAMMHAVAFLKRSGITPRCEVWLAAVVDEESTFLGVNKLCERLEAEAAIVAEPTELRLVIASKGTVRWRIRVLGRSAHSAKPQLGINAITHMARLVLALEDENQRLTQKTHPLLGPATLSVGVIRGGVQINVVPNECSIDLDRRLLPGESVSEILAAGQQLLASLKERIPGFDAVMEPPMFTAAPLETPADSAPVRFARHILDELGLDSTPVGVPFCSDASKLAQFGIPSILFGPGSIDQAHAAVEFVECAQVVKVCEFYRKFIEHFG